MTLSKKWNTGWKPDMIGYWVIGAGCLIEKCLELSHSPPNCSDDFRK